MDKGNVDIVLVRMDKIGDLVLSLPVDEHPALGGQRVVWFITKGLSFITEQSAPKRTAVEFKRGFGPFEYFRMWRWFKRHNPQTIVLLHCPWWVSMAAWWAGVPERIGRKSQWHSFLFLNVGIRQKRSKADRHESDFNFDILEWGLNRLGIRKTLNLIQAKQTYLHMVAPNPFGTLESRGLKSKGYRVVHPGMAGSALNWPQAHYVKLIEMLADDKPVLITGTKMDRKYLQGIQRVKEHPNVKWLVEELKINELLDVLSEARSVIAPSTGVLHLAASLGTPAIGIYSPRKVEHPRRWGPKGPHVTYLLPNVPEAEKYKPVVMEEISPKDVFEAVITLEGGRARHNSKADSRI
jgi:ADP-heptose:LPS heptosyltransferase